MDKNREQRAVDISRRLFNRIHDQAVELHESFREMITHPTAIEGRAKNKKLRDLMDKCFELKQIPGANLGDIFSHKDFRNDLQLSIKQAKELEEAYNEYEREIIESSMNNSLIQDIWDIRTYMDAILLIHDFNKPNKRTGTTSRNITRVTTFLKPPQPEYKN